MRRAAIVAALAAAFSLFAVPALARKQHAGPCHHPEVISLVNRPGSGPYATTGGSPCTVPRGHVVVETGYRNEVDVGPGGTSKLSSYPMALVRFGISRYDEVFVLPPTTVIRAGANVADLFVPSVGTLDTGFGWKHNLESSDHFQEAAEIVATLPTGTNGFSAGAPSYSATYLASFAPPGKLGIFTSFTLSNASGTTNEGTTRRYASYAPTLSLSYALTDSTGLTLSDSETIPAGPSGGSSNVLLVALQRALSPGVVVDVESDFNLTPATGYRERAIGFGGAFAL